jgi:DNA-binding NarL/FixJ family response regulator
MGDLIRVLLVDRHTAMREARYALIGTAADIRAVVGAAGDGETLETG